MKTIFVVWKVFCFATLAVPGLLLFYRDWKTEKQRARKRYNRQTRWGFGGLIAAALAGAAGIWIDPFLQDQIANAELLATTPHPGIKIYEQSDSSVVVEISSPTTNKHLMQNLSLSFDIPGKNARCRIVDATRAENCSMTNRHLASVSHDTVAESVHLFCKSILPSGFVRARVDYERTRRRPVPGSIEAAAKLRGAGAATATSISLALPRATS